MEAVRQMIGAIYLAFGNAVGDAALEEANKTITRACDCGSIDDPYAVSALRALVRASSPKRKVANPKRVTA